MRRQHSAPVIVDHDGITAISLRPFTRGQEGHGISEADIQALVHACPGSLPIDEIDPIFTNPVPICRELNTPAGPIDNLLMTAAGMPVIVECKLWKNPEGRREVIGQILDYAKELAKWTCSDLQREVNRRLKRKGNSVFELVQEVHRDIDEIAFNDAVTFNLRRGRFLLLIVGDGIREGVEAISDYIRLHSGLHFSLGLVEMPIFQLPDGRKLATPRVLARTLNIEREVFTFSHSAEPHNSSILPDAKDARETGPSEQGTWNLGFWTEVLEGLSLDDPDVQLSTPTRLTYHSVFITPNIWLTLYRNLPTGVGILVGCPKSNAQAEAEIDRLVQTFPDLKEALNGGARISRQSARTTVSDYLTVGDLYDLDQRWRAVVWLRERLNTFVNVLKPLLQSWEQDEQAR